MPFDTTWSNTQGGIAGATSGNYEAFLEKKTQLGGMHGFAPLWMPAQLFDFQHALVEWALRKGRAAIFADCGLGKSFQQLVWAQNVVQKTNGRVLILTPLAVGPQTVHEGEKFGIACRRVADGSNLPKSGIFVTNYEKLHKFDSTAFVAVVCDESSILKHFAAATQKAVSRFMLKLPYRLLCTATAAPNDYIELGTSSEALGMLGYSDMLSRFFVMDDKKRHRMNDVKLARDANTGNHFAKLAYRVAQQIGAWRLKGHAEQPFWRWVCSWARACRKPSDLGFDDGDFILPPLVEREHVIEPQTAPDGMLFTLPAFGLKEERDERRRTLKERCEYVAELVNHGKPAMVWCHFNPEGNLLAKLLPDAVHVYGSLSDDEKEAAYQQFLCGEKRVMINKPKIGAWGLNFQHCAHVVTFASHSYEQRYQSVRRCWRFGQKEQVVFDTVATTGEQHVMENMARKAKAMDMMFTALVAHMQDALHINRTQNTFTMEMPSWLR